MWRTVRPDWLMKGLRKSDFPLPFFVFPSSLRCFQFPMQRFGIIVEAGQTLGNTAPFGGVAECAFCVICFFQKSRFTSSKPSISEITSATKFTIHRSTSFVRYCSYKTITLQLCFTKVHRERVRGRSQSLRALRGVPSPFPLPSPSFLCYNILRNAFFKEQWL